MDRSSPLLCEGVPNCGGGGERACAVWVGIRGRVTGVAHLDLIEAGEQQRAWLGVGGGVGVRGWVRLGAGGGGAKGWG